jgi:hypothetical protein
MVAEGKPSSPISRKLLPVLALPELLSRETRFGAGGPLRQNSAKSIEAVRSTVDAIYRNESRRILATLIRLLGDFDLAEEALHESVAAALDNAHCATHVSGFGSQDSS